MANSKYEYVKREFESRRHLPASNWIVIRIDGCHFHRGHILAALYSERKQNSIKGGKGHINNLYNTCFWMLVKSGKTEKEAHQALKGTFSKDKNKLLLEQFQVNYNDEPAMFRKGSSVYLDKVETEDDGNPLKRTCQPITVSNIDIIGPEFWEKHPYILGEVSVYQCLGGKEIYGYEYAKKFDDIPKLRCSNWTIVRISTSQFDQFSLFHSFNKPNDETALRLMNVCASLMMEEFRDIIFGYGFDNEYSFVFHEKTELYERDERSIISACVCSFTSFYIMKWNEYFPGKILVRPPRFVAEIDYCPNTTIVCDYLSQRQLECHNRNQYKTCFWMLVKSGEDENKAKEMLKNMLRKGKNELLFQRFGMNYNNEPAIFRKGSCAHRPQKVGEYAEVEGCGDVTRSKQCDVAVAHVDMGPHFWRNHRYVLN